MPGYGEEELGYTSTEFARMRSVTERMVLKFKRYDMLGGAPVHMSEWGMMDHYLNVVATLVLLQGPLPDHLVPSGQSSPGSPCRV
jgi:hypothetical protein